MRQGRGHQYQNFLDKKLSAELIHKVEPDVAIFSGDDHDYCLYTHHQAQNAYTEVRNLGPKLSGLSHAAHPCP